MKKKTLNRQLASYGRQAKADLEISRRGFRSGPTAAFAIAAAALAAPDVASASIIYHDVTGLGVQFIVPNITGNYTSSKNATLKLDLDGDGLFDLRFFGRNSQEEAGNQKFLGATALPGGASLAILGGRAGIFKSALIGPGLNFSTRAPLATNRTSRAGTESHTGFEGIFGFRFHPNGESQFAYGWIDLDLTDLDPFHQKEGPSLTVLRWAYDDSGAPILAGGTERGTPTPDAPEPGTLATMTWIGLLALGAAGRAEMKRRKALRAA